MTNLDATTPQLKLVKEWLDAYRTLDIKNIKPLTSKNYTYKTFPKTVHPPDETKEAHLERYEPIMASFAKMDSVVHEVIEAPGKVVRHATMVCSTADGTTVEYEYVSIISFIEEDGKLKIDGVKSFADPAKSAAFHAASAKALGKGEHVA